MQLEEMLKRLKEIQRGSVIYTTRYKRKYKFVCLSQFKNEEAIEYSIPHRDDDGFETKKIRTNHILKALNILLKEGSIQKGDLKGNDCSNYCNFCALGGMLEKVDKKKFSKKHGKISINKNE